jgi:ABC-type uncharacterized transport system substrate-binding protein
MRSAMITSLTHSPRAYRSPIPKLLIAWTVAIALVPARCLRPRRKKFILSVHSIPVIRLSTHFEGFRERMTEFGYRERHNARYQYHNSRGNEELLRTIAHRLVYDKVDLIVTSSTTATKAATRATQGVPIPVVFLSAGNSQKLFKSFRHW